MNVQKKLALAYIRTRLNLLSVVNQKKAAEVAFRLFCTPPEKKFKQSEVFSKAEKLSFSMNGNTIRGFRCNHPQKHKVLLLHGFSSSCQNFNSYVQPLTDKGYEVLAFDAPAHGRSDGDTINAAEYADMIREVIRLYGPINSFIAHSFGGIAVCLALEQMEHSDNTKIVLIAPATETITAIDKAFEMLSITNSNLRASFDDIIYKISGKETAWFSIRRAINNIRANVLWIHDEEDDITPLSDALKVKDDRHAHVQYMITKGLGHYKIYRDATVKKEAVSFL